MKSAARGFTIVEAMVTIAILGVVAAIAIPNLISLTNSNRLSSSSNEMLAAFTLARSEALRSGRSVVVCKSSDFTACNAGAGWADGWLVFVDDDADDTVDAGEAVLRTGSSARGVTVTGSGGAENLVIFTPRGAVNRKNGTQLQLALTLSGQTSRYLCFGTTGRVNLQSGSACTW